MREILFRAKRLDNGEWVGTGLSIVLILSMLKMIAKLERTLLTEKPFASSPACGIKTGRGFGRGMKYDTGI